MILNLLLFYNTLSRNQRQFLIGMVAVLFLMLSEIKTMQQATQEVRTAQKNYVARRIKCNQYQQQIRYGKHPIRATNKQINTTPLPTEIEWVGILAKGTQYWAFLKQADQTIIGLSLNEHLPDSPWQIVALTKKQIVLEHNTTHTQWIKDFA